MRKILPDSKWKEIETLYASGVSAGEIAVQTGISRNTITSRARRHKWSIKSATAILERNRGLAEDLRHTRRAETISVPEIAALSMRERAERYTKLMAKVTGERTIDHLEDMSPEKMLEQAGKIELLDRVARRSFGLDKEDFKQPLINLSFLSSSHGERCTQ